MRTTGLSLEERDALRDLVLDRLSGIDDLGIAISRRDYRKAERLAGVYSDFLTLMLLDLGWADLGHAVDQFSTPPRVLERVLGRLREAAKSPQDFLEKDRTAAEVVEDRNRLVLRACSRTLGISEKPAVSK